MCNGVKTTTTTTEYDLSHFVRITSIEQRNQYKAEFSREYPEYLELCEMRKDVSRRFAQHRRNLRSLPRHSLKYIEIHRRVQNDIDRVGCDEQFQESLKRFSYLQIKLLHIKGLVKEFDSIITKNRAKN